MTELQKRQFELLKAVDDICNRLKIKYFLVCGSALGAVKYGGFIPWDDDIDIALFREDYEKFISKAPNLLREGLFLQNWHSEKYYLQVFSKLRDSNSTYIESSVSRFPINHGVFITDSMEILSKITNNEVYKKIINTTLINLSRGDSISSAFKGEWAIPIVAYEMIVTGETTGQLGTMMEKVAVHFQSLHKTIIDQMKSLIEPILICFLAGIVGVILISIIQPMFSIYSQIQ